MKKIKLSLLCVLVISACSRSPEKPKLTVDEYARQGMITKGVLEKILAEADYKKMHEIAAAVETSRAVDCVAIGEECNVYGEVLNKIVVSSKNRLPSDTENVEIYKKIGELDVALRKGHGQLEEQWKIYTNASQGGH